MSKLKAIVFDDSILPADFEHQKRYYVVSTKRGWDFLSNCCDELKIKSNKLEQAIKGYQLKTLPFIISLANSADSPTDYLERWFTVFVSLCHQIFFLRRGHVIRKNHYLGCDSKIMKRPPFVFDTGNVPNPNNYLETWVSVIGLRYGGNYLDHLHMVRVLFLVSFHFHLCIDGMIVVVKYAEKRPCWGNNQHGTRCIGQ